MKACIMCLIVLRYVILCLNFSFFADSVILQKMVLPAQVLFISYEQTTPFTLYHT